MFAREATREDLVHVTSRMSDLDVDRHRGMTHLTERQDVLDSWVERYSAMPGMMAFGLEEDDPIAIFGIMPLRKGVATLVMVCTPELDRIILPLTRFLRRTFAAMEKAGVHRFESTILETQHEIRKWLPMIGLHLEATHRKYGTRGEDYVQYARLADTAPPRG